MAKHKGKKRRRHNAKCAVSQTPHQAKRSHAVGLPLTIALEIPAYWTPDEALAVFELVDELHNRIWSIYRNELQDLICHQRQNKLENLFKIDHDDPPF